MALLSIILPVAHVSAWQPALHWCAHSWLMSPNQQTCSNHAAEVAVGSVSSLRKSIAGPGVQNGSSRGARQLTLIMLKRASKPGLGKPGTPGGTGPDRTLVRRSHGRIAELHTNLGVRVAAERSQA